METVLVIEDDDNNLTLIRDLLEYNGYAVLAARNGAEGARMAAGHRPDLIILDIKLPDMDGEKVLRRLRRNRDLAGTPVVAMTSYAMTGDRERLLEAGCDGYIEKPVDPDRVIAQIREVGRR
jgi:two-component system cell cycle response regulator DivK